MKYNKSEIMKSAWNLFKMFQKWAAPLSFSECLRRAWDNAKRTLEATKKLMSNGCMKVINGSRLGLIRTIAADYTMGWIVTGKTYAAPQGTQGCRLPLGSGIPQLVHHRPQGR